MKRLMKFAGLFVVISLLYNVNAMAQTNQVTYAKAKQWFLHSEWAPGHGLKASIHPSVDLQEFYIQYHKNKATWDKVYKWFKNTDLIHLAPGKYLIDSDKAFATITEKPLKALANSNFEHHEKHIDFQYVIKGEEKIGVAPFSKASVVIPFSTKKDIGYYSVSKQCSHYYIATPSTIFIFFPENAHRPSLQTKTSKIDKKLVIKIINN